MMISAGDSGTVPSSLDFLTSLLHLMRLHHSGQRRTIPSMRIIQ